MTLTNTNRTQTLLVIVSLLLLTTSWIVLFAVLTVASWSLTPFDAVAPHYIPVGWQSDLNTFVVNTRLTLWIPLGIVGTSVALFLRGATRTTIQQRVTQFLRANVASIVAITLLFVALANLPGFAPPPGYGYVSKFLLKDFLIVVVLLYYQAQRA